MAACHKLRAFWLTSLLALACHLLLGAAGFGLQAGAGLPEAAAIAAEGSHGGAGGLLAAPAEGPSSSGPAQPAPVRAVGGGSSLMRREGPAEDDLADLAARNRRGYWVQSEEGKWSWARRLWGESMLSLPTAPRSKQCSGHEPNKPPQICGFLFTALQNESYRKRAVASLHTWVRNALGLPGFKFHLFVDPKFKHLLNESFPASKIIEKEESHPGAPNGKMVQTRLAHLNETLSGMACDWAVVPEDDAYLNAGLVASKLQCLDPGDHPRLMGATYEYDKGKNMIHGSVWIMNKKAVSVLLKAAVSHQLSIQGGYGDLAVESAVDKDFGAQRHVSFPWNEFGCHVYDNSGATTLFQARAQPQPECVDWFHKVPAEDMAAVHALATRRGPCNRTLDDLMKLCGPSGS